MAFTTKLRMALNKIIKPLNLQVGTLVAEQREMSRLKSLETAGLLDRPLYSLLPGMADFDPTQLAKAYSLHRDDIERLCDAARNDVGYVLKNDYFTSPDMEVLYLLVRTLMPRRIVEVGCGSSTRISRQAIMDGKLATKITAIDPWPRNDIAPYVDKFEKTRLEQIESYEVFESLEAGDFLFIDSSHELRVGNDVARIVCDIIPRLKPGVVLHFHDIFLPYEYPRKFAFEYPSWSEQYILHALMQGRECDVIWPGYYLQRAKPEVAEALPFLKSGQAQSFWLVLK
ncbi:MAG: class I SAM-dependent methyltransferase [Arenimonas sp.]